MDSAPSFLFRREDFPFPNRPVPPPRATWYPGPRYRSYADAVRQPARRWFPPRYGEQDVRRQPADPQFGGLVRKIHAVIKAVHHLQNVAVKPGKAEPKMISRMVELLSTMIKPAAPSRRTRDLIEGNARNWGHTTYLILMEHYEKCLEDFLEELGSHLTPDWKEAFQVAVRWARRNLPRITQDVIDHAEALITARMDGERPVAVPIPLRMTTVQIQGRTQSPREPAKKRTVATMTSEAEDQPLQPTDWHQPPLTSPPPSPPGLPRGQRYGRRTRGTVVTEDSFLQDDPEQQDEVKVLEEPPHTPTHSELEALFDELQAEEEAAAAITSTPQSSVEVMVQVHQEEPQTDEENYEESFDHFTTPGPRRYRVYRHPITQRKLTDWCLDVEKKWLIIGDSNLTSFPEFFNKDVQVESFPGAHFRHAQALMEKTVPRQDLVVEKIILSFGINGRANKSKETTIRSVQGALRSAKRQFPYADVLIPLVNFSTELPQDEQDNLKILNEHVERNMAHIPLLPKREFHTQADDIHWTTETGTAMFNFWMGFLNAGTP